MIHILVVDDDEKLNKAVCTWLNDCGFEAKGVLSANDAYEEMYNSIYELIISDIMMPEVDGFEFARSVREINRQIPILFMSAKDDLTSKQKGFQIGIDDYMVKPIDVNELLLRVEALLRRAKIIYEKKLEFDHVCLDYINLTVTIDDNSQILPQKEFQLLYKLLSFPNHTFTRQQIMDELWGYDSETDIRTVDVHINRLRDRFRDIPYFQIQTVRGLGYKGMITK